jgi:hypothetical protein
MATKRSRSNVKNLVNSDMKTRELPTRPATKNTNLVPHTFMIEESDLASLRDFAKYEGCSLNAAARLAIKRLLRSNARIG